MSEALVFLGPALAMCVIIASIHVYLGLHVLVREVIFGLLLVAAGAVHVVTKTAT